MLKAAHIGRAIGVHTAPTGTILPITITRITVYRTGDTVFPSISAGDDPGEAGDITPTTVLIIGADIMITGVITAILSTLLITEVIGEVGTDTIIDLLLSTITMQ